MKYTGQKSGSLGRKANPGKTYPSREAAVQAKLAAMNQLLSTVDLSSIDRKSPEK